MDGAIAFELGLQAGVGGTDRQPADNHAYDEANDQNANDDQRGDKHKYRMASISVLVLGPWSLVLGPWSLALTRDNKREPRLRQLQLRRVDRRRDFADFLSLSC